MTKNNIKFKKRYRFLYNIILLCLVLITLYVALGQLFITKVRNYKETLTVKLSELIGAPVSIESLEGSWSIFSPNIIVKNIFIGTPERNLQAEKLVIELNLPKSVLNLDVKVTNIWAERLKLQVIQYPDGGWAPGGIPRQEDPVTIPMILTELQRFAKISLYDSQITVFPLGEDPHTFHNISATLTQLVTNHSLLEGTVHLDEKKQKPLSLSLDAYIIPEKWEQLDATLYAQITPIDWASWWPKAINLPWKFKQLELGGSVWTTLKNGQVTDLTFVSQGNNLQVQYEKNPVISLQDLSLKAWFKKTSTETQLQLNDLSVTIGEKTFKDFAGFVKHITVDNQSHWRVAANSLDITNTISVATNFMPLPKSINDGINTVQPSGTIHNLNIDYAPYKPLLERVHFEADLQDIAFSPYDQTAGASHITGHIKGGIKQGYLDLDSKDFSLFIAKLYNHPWQYHSAKGKLQWSYDKDTISLSSSLIKLSAEEGDITGDVMIRLFPNDSIRNYMDLRVNLTNGDASYAPKYIPTKDKDIDPDLIKWLQTAIKAGHINNGTFQYFGSIDKDTPPTDHSMLLYFDVKDATIKYDPQWPLVTQLSGEVFVEPSGVQIYGKQGLISQTRLADVNISIPDTTKPAIPHLYLTGKLESNVQDTLSILQNAPPKIATNFKHWQGNGALTGQLTLDIPLTKHQEPIVKIDFSTQNAELALPHPVPPLKQIKGKFHYDSLIGLSTPRVTSTVFGMPASGHITAIGKRGKPISRALVHGQINVHQLSNWLLQKKLPLPLSGNASYNLNLVIGPQNTLNVTSTMKGVTLDLPAPFYKAANTTQELSFNLEFADNKQTKMQLHYGLVNAIATLWPDKISTLKGEVRINAGKASITKKEGLRVFGEVNTLDLEQWQRIIKPFLTTTNYSGNTGSLNFIRDINLRFGKVTGFGVTPQQMAIYIQPVGSTAWRMDAYSKDISGRITIPLIKNLPYYVSLKYLKLPKSLLTNTSKNTLPLKNFNLENIPPIDLLITQLYLGDDLIGHVRLNSKAQGKRLQISNISTDLKGLRIKGSLDWHIGLKTSFNGNIFGKDLATVMKNWKLDPTVTSHKFNIALSGYWPGTPMDLKAETLTGQLETTLTNGRLLTVDSSKTNALRVFGILNLDAINRRLRMDFSDLVSSGLTYDEIKADFTINNGVYYTDKPMTFSGPSLNISATGNINMKTEQIDAILKVGVPLGSSLSFAALAILPPLGGAMLIVDHFMGDKLMKLIAISYTVKGNWNDPSITLGKKG